MKTLTKPEKFRAMSRIYGYEELYDYVDEISGTQEVLVTFEAEQSDGTTIIWEEYECQDTTDDLNEC